MPTDDDIDSLADTSGDLIRISPYPGPLKFGAWCESQFSNVIPKGAAEFLEQFNILSEADVYHWINLDAREYLKLLGPEQYDNVRKTLTELRTIRKYIDSQLDKKDDTPKWSYLDYLSLRMMNAKLDSCYYPESRDIMDLRPNSIKNIRILPSSSLPHPSPKKPKVSQNDPVMTAPTYKANSPALEKGDDPPTQGSSHSKTSFHESRPRAFLEGQYFNVNGPPPQFWGASNLSWMRSQRMDPTQSSNRSYHGSYKPNHSSYK